MGEERFNTGFDIPLLVKHPWEVFADLEMVVVRVNPLLRLSFLLLNRSPIVGWRSVLG